MLNFRRAWNPVVRNWHNFKIKFARYQFQKYEKLRVGDLTSAVLLTSKIVKNLTMLSNRNPTRERGKIVDTYSTFFPRNLKDG